MYMQADCYVVNMGVLTFRFEGDGKILSYVSHTVVILQMSLSWGVASIPVSQMVSGGKSSTRGPAWKVVL